MFKKPLVYICFSLLFFGCSIGYYLGNRSAVSKIEYVDRPVTTVVAATPTPERFLNENELLDLVNSYRKENSLPLLQENPILCQFATVRSQEIVSKKDWSHDGFFARTSSYLNNFIKLGEDLAQYYTEEDQILNAWKESPLHKKQLDDPVFNRACVSITEDTAVLIFGQSR